MAPCRTNAFCDAGSIRPEIDKVTHDTFGTGQEEADSTMIPRYVPPHYINPPPPRWARKHSTAPPHNAHFTEIAVSRA